MNNNIFRCNTLHQMIIYPSFHIRLKSLKCSNYISPTYSHKSPNAHASLGVNLTTLSSPTLSSKIIQTKLAILVPSYPKKPIRKLRSCPHTYILKNFDPQLYTSIHLSLNYSIPRTLLRRNRGTCPLLDFFILLLK